MCPSKKCTDCPLRIGIVLFSLVAVLLNSCGNDCEKVLPLTIDITESVYASALVQPDSLYDVHAPVNGILDHIQVQEGDTVQQGDVLFKIIDTNPLLNSKNAKLNLELARVNYGPDSPILKKIRADIDAARLSLTNDSINYYRQKRLWEQKIGSKMEYDSRKLAYELSQKKLNRLQSEYRRMEKELAIQFEQAKNTYISTQTNAEDFTVRSKIKGTVYAVNKEPGELVTTSQPLAAIGSSTDFLIEMLVDEVDIVKLHKGQRTFITLDAYPNKVFEAHITKIYPKKDEKSQTFKVEGVFDESPETLYPGLAGEANIIIATKKNALVVPKAYFMDDFHVLTEDGPVKVTTGLQNLEYVEIVEGLTKDTEIIKPTQ